MAVIFEIQSFFWQHRVFHRHRSQYRALSQTKRRTKKKRAVQSCMQDKQPSTSQYLKVQQQPSALGVSFMFLLAVFSHNQTIFQIK